MAAGASFPNHATPSPAELTRAPRNDGPRSDGPRIDGTCAQQPWYARRRPARAPSPHAGGVVIEEAVALSIERSGLPALGILLLASLTSATAQEPATDRFRSEGRPKVIGGSMAKIEDWPWQAVLRVHDAAARKSAYICGGSVIAPHWVLTAAHCLADQQALGVLKGAFKDQDDALHEGDLQVVLGVDDLQKVDGRAVHAIERVFVHPAYMRAYEDALNRGLEVDDALFEASINTGNDIALVKLTEPWQGAIARLSLAEETDPVTPPGTDARVAGFGDLEPLRAKRGLKRFRRSDGAEDYVASEHLMDVKLPTVATTRCLATYQAYVNEIGKKPYAKATIDAGQICAGTEQGGHDSCQGDSGGPLVAYDGQSQKYQIGVVSWGHDCAVAGLYGVYTRVSAHAAWLAEQIGKLDAAPLASVAVSALDPRRPDPNKTRFVEAALGQLAEALGPQGRIRLGIAGGTRVRLGNEYGFEVRAETAGRLILIDVDANHNVTPLFPNGFVHSSEFGRVEAGQKLIVPAADGSWGFRAFGAVPPIGAGKLIALIVPKSFPFERTVAAAERLQQRSKGFEPVPPAPYLMNVLEQVLETRAKSPAHTDWAWATLDYEIIP